MFERFTDRGRRVVTRAQEEARNLKHNYIGTEHLLLALLFDEEAVACKALKSLGLELDSVRTLISTKVGEGAIAPNGHIPFTPRAKKVLELALREALQLGHNYIGTEHLLLALIREGEGLGATTLESLGLKDTARKRVLEILGRQWASPPSAHDAWAKKVTKIDMFVLHCSYCNSRVTNDKAYPTHLGAIEEARKAGALLTVTGDIACVECQKRPLGELIS